MNCCQCQGIEQEFNEKVVRQELETYRANGAPKTTQYLVNTLKAMDIRGFTLLDIGGGVGAIQHELLAAGLQKATDIDASRAYIQAARSEAQRRGFAEHTTFLHGNFVELAEQIPPADIVTLDRVICCYPDMEKMVSLSVARAGKLYGLVYPRDTWWSRLSLGAINLWYRLQKSSFRTYVHSTRSVEALIIASGLKRVYFQQTPGWQVVVYAR